MTVYVDDARHPFGRNIPKPKTRRRVYTLPRKMVEDIRAFAIKGGFESEVDAVRYLLRSELDKRGPRA